MPRAVGGGGKTAQPRKALTGSSTVRNGSGGTTSFQPNKPYRKLGENATNLGAKPNRKQATTIARVSQQRKSDALKGSAASSSRYASRSTGKSLRQEVKAKDKVASMTRANLVGTENSAPSISRAYGKGNPYLKSMRTTNTNRVKADNKRFSATSVKRRKK